MAHAFVIAGDTEVALKEARIRACAVLGISDGSHPDLIECTYDLLSVDDARELARLAGMAPVAGAHKVFLIQTARIFHEAQNALLKLFEEPPAGTVLYLVLPHTGTLLPTLRSRVEVHTVEDASGELARAFVVGSPKEREKIIATLVERARKEDTQGVRAEAEIFVAGLIRLAHAMPNTPAQRAFLRDAARLLPILGTRSAPLKQILEHVLLTFPVKTR